MVIILSHICYSHNIYGIICFLVISFRVYRMVILPEVDDGSALPWVASCSRCWIIISRMGLVKATFKNSTFRDYRRIFFEPFACFTLLTSLMLLSLERANAKALLFTRLIATLPKSFYFFFNRIARYDGSKESRNLSSKIPQITCKAIFRSCLYNKEVSNANRIQILK